MMNYSEFKKFVEENVNKYLPKNYDGQSMKVTSINKADGVYDGIFLSNEDKLSVSPIFRLDFLYEKYVKGSNENQLLNHLLKDFIQKYFDYMKEESQFTQEIKDVFQDWKTVKTHLGFTLENKENYLQKSNVGLYTELFDMVKVYKLFFDNGDTIGTAQLNQSLLDMWNISLQELDRIATENMKKMFPAKMAPLDTILSSESSLPVLVLTAGDAFSAAAGLYEEQLKNYREKVKEDFYLLPSSKHEFLVIPKSAMNEEEAFEMLQHGNEHAVEKEDLLSRNLYAFTEKGFVCCRMANVH